MADEKEKGGPSAYPPGYEDLFEVIREARARIADLDKKIDALRPNRGYTHIFRPPGAEFSTRKPGSFEHNFDGYVEWREQIIAQTERRIVELTTDGDRTTNLTVRKQARENFYTREDLAMDRGPLDQVQDRMAERVVYEKAQPSRVVNAQPPTEKPVGETDPKPETSPKSSAVHTMWSSRLSFTQAVAASVVDNDKPIPDRGQDIEKPVVEEWYDMGERHRIEDDAFQAREREALAEFEEQHLDMTPEEQNQFLELRLQFTEQRAHLITSHYVDALQLGEEMQLTIEANSLEERVPEADSDMEPEP